MASSTPSEFLTFYRHALRKSRMLPRPAAPVRAITYSAPYRADIGSDKPHTNDKKDRLDTQNDASRSGKEANATGTGGTATSGGGAKSSVDKAKKEHPSAPDAKIGFQDERGGKL